MAKNSEARINANRRYNEAHLSRLVAWYRNEEQLSEKIAAAVQAGKADSKQAYIIQAVKDRLSKDGF